MFIKCQTDHGMTMCVSMEHIVTIMPMDNENKTVLLNMDNGKQYCINYDFDELLKVFARM